MEYERKRKTAKKAMNRYRNRLSALSDVMDYIDIDQTTFDQFKHLFSAPPEVPENVYLRHSNEREECTLFLFSPYQ